jgi:uncharacterized protein YgbK (DUF1537 family)
VPLVKISSAKLADSRANSKEAKELAVKVQAHLQNGKSCIVCTDGGVPGGDDSAEKIAKGLAQFAAFIIEGSGGLNLSVFGGDTLLSLMDALNMDRLVPLTEIEPGVVLAHAKGNGKKMAFVTKSGAFGSEDSLTNIIKRLTQ